jgi:hypothetical protein
MLGYCSSSSYIARAATIALSAVTFWDPSALASHPPIEPSKFDTARRSDATKHFVGNIKT